MSFIGHWTPEKFVVDFPLDFGNGVRGDWLDIHNKHVGVLVVHEVSDGEVCGGAVYWAYRDRRIALISEEPLTLMPSISCSCGMAGFITEGSWQKL